MHAPAWLADISHIDQEANSSKRVHPSLSVHLAVTAFNRRCCLRMQRDIDIKNISQLRQFVSRTLCQKNDFEEGVFQVTEKILTKCGKLCGVLFCLHGPRSIKLTAVWDTDNNSILFYGSTGERFKKILIPSGLNLT